MVLPKMRSKCFRPLPGYLISQYELRNMKFRELPFPSPSGVSHFSIVFRGLLNSPPKFPSPSGVSHFSICQCRFPCCFDTVSVPFRGISFLNPVPHTPHFIQLLRVFCVGKPNWSNLSFPNCLKIPANPVFKPCAGKYALPSFFTSVYQYLLQ